MIDITDFVLRYNGLYVEVAGSAAQNQCVDLANLYLRDVLHLPMIEWTNAKDFPSKAGTNFTWIANTPTGVPEEGDLVIWSGTYGHIAIFMDGNINDFHTFDQNYPTGTPCHIQYHNYTNVTGWLRPKNPPVVAPVCDPNWRIERDKNWDLYLAEVEKVKTLTAQLAQKEQEKQTWLQRIKDFINAL